MTIALRWSQSDVGLCLAVTQHEMLKETISGEALSEYVLYLKVKNQVYSKPKSTALCLYNNV